MAEKAFKVPALGLVGTTAELAVNTSTTELLWNALPLASKFYVDSAVDNVTVNVAALAGNRLTYNAITDALDLDSAGVNNDAGQALSGNALVFNPNTKKIDVNTFAIGTTLQGDGLTFNAATGALGVNTFVIGSALQGSDLTFNAATGQLGVNTGTIATKSYVDGVAQGLDIKESVKFSSTSNVNINDLWSSNGQQGPIGGLDHGANQLSSGDRILLKNQSNEYENGIWVVSSSSEDYPTRATDADSFEKLNEGSFVFVEGGSNGGKGFVVSSTNQSAPFGEQGSSIIFTQFSEAGSYITSVSAPFGVLNGNLALAIEPTLSVSELTGLGVNATALVHFGGGLESVTGTDLAINYTNPLTIDPETGKLGLSTSTALYLDAEYGYLTVNGTYITEIVASNLTSTDYGASSFYIANNTAKALSKVHSVNTSSSDTWVTVGALDFVGTSAPESFEASVVMRLSSGETRSSKISGIYDSAAGAEYTEYAIVEQGGTISGADVQVDGSGNIQVKATITAGSLDAVMSVTTLGYWT